MEQLLVQTKSIHQKAKRLTQGKETVGTLIREWRTLRKLSQMELALESDISPRHLSFVETGRSKPSAQVLMTMANHLDIPLRTRNTLLLAAGFAPRYSEQSLGSAQMAQIKSAIQRLLDTHDPYPGVALDGQWNVVLHNKSSERLIGLLPAHLKHPSVNMFRASLHPEGFAQHTENFDEWGSYLLQVLHRLVSTSRDEATTELAREIYSYPNVQKIRARAVKQPPSSSSLLVPCVLNLQGHEVSLFTTLTTFGSPRDITLHELFIELFYPSNETTEQFLKAAIHVSPNP